MLLSHSPSQLAPAAPDRASPVATISNDPPLPPLPTLPTAPPPPRPPTRPTGDHRRVILRPFVMSNGRVRTLFERLDAMSEDVAGSLLGEGTASFADRHARLAAAFDEHFKIGVELTGWNKTWSKAREALAGAYLTMEYAVDSAALFN